MEFESENIRIVDQEGVPEEVDAQMSRILKKINNILRDEDVNVQVALSLFATMYAKTACGIMELPKEVAIEAITGVLEMYCVDDEDRGELQ